MQLRNVTSMDSISKSILLSISMGTYGTGFKWGAVRNRGARDLEFLPCTVLNFYFSIYG